MTVRELIKDLVDYNLDAEIVVATDKKYVDKRGEECKRRMFEIKNIDTFGSCVEILFDDWRDGENKKECSTCKSDNSLENCLGCIEYEHWELKGDNKQSRCNSCQNNTDELSGECYECVKGIEDWYEPIAELEGGSNEQM